MPLFMVNKKHFDSYRFGKKDAEVRAVRPQWKKTKIGDVATIQSGRKIFRKRVTNIYRGSLARIFLKIDYKRAFPEASTVFEAVKEIKYLSKNAEEYIAFELEEFQ